MPREGNAPKVAKVKAPTAHENHQDIYKISTISFFNLTDQV